MGMGTIVERLAIGIAHSEARDRHRLASKGIPTVLEVEESPSGFPGGISPVKSASRQEMRH